MDVGPWVVMMVIKMNKMCEDQHFTQFTYSTNLGTIGQTSSIISSLVSILRFMNITKTIFLSH